MSILPADKPHEMMETPRNFFIYGAPMSGKSYLASKFSHPFILNTDGNALAGTAPSVQLKNVRNEKGTITNGVIDQLDKYILALQTESHTFQTVIIDVVEDVVDLVEQQVKNEFNVKSLADVGYGRGYAAVNDAIKEMVINLKALPMTVVYISRLNEREEDGKNVQMPALRTKYYNIVAGNVDMIIKTDKTGTKYTRRATDKRKKYIASQIGDKRIAQILSVVMDALEPEPKTQGK